MSIDFTAEKKAYVKFIAAGMTPFGACALIGNLEAESDGFYPWKVEYLCIRRMKEYNVKDKSGNYYTQESYNKALDAGEISCEQFLHPISGRQYGYGLAQWTTPGRKAGLWNMAHQKGVSMSDLDMQLEYLMKELEESYPSVLKTLKSATSIREASDVVLKKYEAPADTGETVCAGRAARGQKFYDEYMKKQKEDTNMSYDPQKAIDVATAELGYLEKKSNASLDSKTANAGSNNYTKYWRDMANLGLGNYQAQYWCAGFIAWVFYMAYGLKAMQLLLLQSFYINCSVMANLAKKAGQLYSSPKIGDVILFYSKGKGYYHTGLAVDVTSTTVTTIEGNTSGGSSVIANGGGVAKKTYNLNSLNAKFMRPNYGSAVSTGSNKSYLSIGDTGKDVQTMQTMLIAIGFLCGSAGADGSFGGDTDKGLRAFQEAYNLEVDGKYGPASKTALESVYNQMYKPAATKTVEQLAREVIAGKWDSGEARKVALAKAGYDYAAVQARVNELLKSGSSLKPVTEIAKEVIAGKWGNGDERKKKLAAAGYDYDAVQKKVNELLK